MHTNLFCYIRIFEYFSSNTKKKHQLSINRSLLTQCYSTQQYILNNYSSSWNQIHCNLSQLIIIIMFKGACKGYKGALAMPKTGYCLLHNTLTARHVAGVFTSVEWQHNTYTLMCVWVTEAWVREQTQGEREGHNKYWTANGECESSQDVCEWNMLFKSSVLREYLQWYITTLRGSRRVSWLCLFHGAVSS